MRTKLLVVASVIIVAVIALLVVVAAQPADFRVARSATVAAPAAAAFARVNDLRAWDAWSPYAKKDPAMRQSFEGPAAGVGAVSRWAGNAEVGQGSMTVTESVPGERVRLRLDFVEPFAGTNTVEFTFRPDGDRTAVTWAMDGRKNFVCKAIGLVMDMDRMCGDDFEKGLAQLKVLAEADAARTATAAAAAQPWRGLPDQSRDRQGATE